MYSVPFFVIVISLGIFVPFFMYSVFVTLNVLSFVAWLAIAFFLQKLAEVISRRYSINEEPNFVHSCFCCCFQVIKLHKQVGKAQGFIRSS